MTVTQTVVSDFDAVQQVFLQYIQYLIKVKKVYINVCKKVFNVLGWVRIIRLIPPDME